MTYGSCGITHRERGKATAEEWMGRVGNLYLGEFFFSWVIEVGTKLMTPSTTSATNGWLSISQRIRSSSESG